MNLDAIMKEYDMDTNERIAFIQHIKNSNYKYTKSFWSGIEIDTSENIESIVEEFRKGYKKRFISLEEAREQGVTTDIQSKLIECPDCGKQVSRRANACIHCGCPLTPNTGSTQSYIYGVRELDGRVLPGKAGTYIARASIINRHATGVKDVSIVASGITKERAELLLKFMESHNKKGEIVVDLECTQENEEMTRYIDANINPNAPVTCPRCGSTNVIVGQRGFNVVSGAVGSGRTTNRCGKCGLSWKPEIYK